MAHGQGDESGYDLTNPNLHHGADIKYGPTVQTSTQSGSIFHSDVGVVSGPTVNESFHLAVGGSGTPSAVIAELSGYEGQTFSSSVAGRPAGSATGDRLTSASLPTVHMDEYTGSISGARTGGDFGNEPIAARTTEAHAHAVSANLDPAASVSGLTATSIADQSGYEGKAFLLMSPAIL